jgi:hypothetical protein
MDISSWSAASYERSTTPAVDIPSQRQPSFLAARPAVATRPSSRPSRSLAQPSNPRLPPFRHPGQHGRPALPTQWPAVCEPRLSDDRPGRDQLACAGCQRGAAARDTGPLRRATARAGWARDRGGDNDPPRPSRDCGVSSPIAVPADGCRWSFAWFLLVFTRCLDLRSIGCANCRAAAMSRGTIIL